MTIYCQSIKTSHGSDEIAFFCDGDVFIVSRSSMLRGHDLQYKHGELQLTNAEILTTDSRIKAEACSLECVIGSICIEPISKPEVTGEDEIIDEWIERPAVNSIRDAADTAPAIAH